MNPKTPYRVVLFDSENDLISVHSYRDEIAARGRYDDSIGKHDIGRVRLFERRATGPGRYGRRYGYALLDEWIDEPDFRVEGYIVHSVCSLNGTSTSSHSRNKVFYTTEREAVAKAKELAERWSDSHEGLIVLKAVKHVYKTPRGCSRIVVKDV